MSDRMNYYSNSKTLQDLYVVCYTKSYRGRLLLHNSKEVYMEYFNIEETVWRLTPHKDTAGMDWIYYNMNTLIMWS